MLLPLDLNEDFINEEGVAVALGAFFLTVGRTSDRACCTTGELVHSLRKYPAQPLDL